MENEDLENLVASIRDNQPATITLTSQDGTSRSYECHFKKGEAVSFFVDFRPETAPDEIDLDTLCPFSSVGPDGSIVSFAAKITERRGVGLLVLEAFEPIELESLRDSFRIKLRAPISVSYGPDSDDEKAWTLKGESLDISQSGVLAILPEDCKGCGPDDVLTLKLHLPNPNHLAVCSAHIVRKRRYKRNWLMAFHFVDIENRTRDIITKNCFAEQRRQLRKKVQVDT